MIKEEWTGDLFIEHSGDPAGEESAKSLSLETGLQTLETIVKTLEKKDLPLDTALGLFKDGVGLVQYCTNVLNQAERQMEILLEGADGKLQIKPASFEMEG